LECRPAIVATRIKQLNIVSEKHGFEFGQKSSDPIALEDQPEFCTIGDIQAMNTEEFDKLTLQRHPGRVVAVAGFQPLNFIRHLGMEKRKGVPSLHPDHARACHPDACVPETGKEARLSDGSPEFEGCELLSSAIDHHRSKP
jgi:hypothetical protein